MFTRFCKYASLIVFVSESTREKFHSIFNNQLNKIENITIRNDACKPLQSLEKKCLYVGSNKNNKNLHLLGKLAKYFVSKSHRIFIFVGISKEDIREKDKNFIFLNDIPDGFLSFLYENTDYFICTSIDEGFCFPVMDALEHGSTVLAISLPVFEELYSDNDNIILFNNENNMLEHVRNL